MKNKNLVYGIIILIIGVLIGFGVTRFTNSNSAKTFTNRTSSSKQVQPAKMEFKQPAHTNKNAKRLFINASMNKSGTTSAMAKRLFGSLSYKQINLSEYDIPQIGQGEGDFNKVWDQMKDADVIVIGTPVYWSNMSGYLTTLIDHMQINDDLKGKDLYAIVQGADANQTAAINSTYGSLNRIAIRFDMNFIGIAQNNSQLRQLHQKMINE